MRNFWTIYKREIKYYATSPVAYVVFIIYLFLVGMIFARAFMQFSDLSAQIQHPMFRQYYGQQNLNITEGVIQAFFGVAGFFLIFVLPLLTMRLLAEEKRMGTSELLFSYPVRDSQVLLGKYFASLTMVFILFLLTSVCPAMVAAWGRPEPGVILAGYLGLFLLSAGFLAFGLFVSACTENQVIASVVPFGVMFLLWLLGNYLLQDMPQNIRMFLYEFSATEHYRPFVEGSIGLKDVAYNLMFAFISLYLALQVMGSRKWRGQQ
ncbi:ABC transporter permease subunit [bacterium]|nr:ABC transporter permease subunit [bacterium]